MKKIKLCRFVIYSLIVICSLISFSFSFASQADNICFLDGDFFVMGKKFNLKKCIELEEREEDAYENLVNCYKSKGAFFFLCDEESKKVEEFKKEIQRYKNFKYKIPELKKKN